MVYLITRRHTSTHICLSSCVWWHKSPFVHTKPGKNIALKKEQPRVQQFVEFNLFESVVIACFLLFFGYRARSSSSQIRTRCLFCSTVCGTDFRFHALLLLSSFNVALSSSSSSSCLVFGQFLAHTHTKSFDHSFRVRFVCLWHTISFYLYQQCELSSRILIIIQKLQDAVVWDFISNKIFSLIVHVH